MSFLDTVNTARPDSISQDQANEKIVIRLSQAIGNGIKSRIVAIAKNTPKDQKLKIIRSCLSLGDHSNEPYQIIVKSESKHRTSLFGAKEYTDSFYEITDFGDRILQRLQKSLASDGISIEGFFMGFGDTAKTDRDKPDEQCGPLRITKAYSLYGKYSFPVETTYISSYYHEFNINKTEGDWLNRHPFLLISFSFSE